ncbi:MAG TPA: hypothetical protein VMJ34_03220 [Bryobacteraceae bacterium]|nr:hypothetical protein [Bryobacteraceae bacterium]
MALAALTTFHVLISLVGIACGFIAVAGMMQGKIAKLPNDWFLITTIGTSVTGYFFPVHQFLPSHALGILSLITLAVAALAYWGKRLQDRWTRTYAIAATVALYFNVFVLVVQAFKHVPVLNQLAPKGAEPPFQISQLVVLLLFIVIGIRAVKGVKKGSAPAARAASV